MRGPFEKELESQSNTTARERNPSSAAREKDGRLRWLGPTSAAAIDAVSRGLRVDAVTAVFGHGEVTQSVVGPTPPQHS